MRLPINGFRRATFRALSALTAVLAVSALSTAAHADSVQVSGKFINFAENVFDVQFDPTLTGGPLTTINTYAGAISTVFTPSVGTGFAFEAYCINLPADIPANGFFEVTRLGTDTFSLRPGVPSGEAAAWLYNNYANSVSNNNIDSAALQVAIWESIYDWDGSNSLNTISLTSGSFQVTTANSAITTKANTYLAAWNGQKGVNATWYKPTGAGQDLIGIPEPGTAALLLPIVAVAGMILRRRKK